MDAAPEVVRARAELEAALAAYREGADRRNGGVSG